MRPGAGHRIRPSRPRLRVHLPFPPPPPDGVPAAAARAAEGDSPARPACDVQRFPQGTAMRVAGIVLTRQRPSTASGVVFVTIEDETGFVNLIVPPRVFDRDRAAARTATAVIALG